MDLDKEMPDPAIADGSEVSGPSSDSSDDVDAILSEAAGAADISALSQELEASKDRYLRLMAEFDNYKRRAGREYERLIESANEKLMLEIIEVRENFERALKAGDAGGGDFTAFFNGMKLIFSKFEEVLGRNGLTVFASPGEAFDPVIHDALMNAPHPEIPADHIVEVFERGYRLKEKVVKHARVIVSSGAPAAVVLPSTGSGNGGGSMVAEPAEAATTSTAGADQPGGGEQ